MQMKSSDGARHHAATATMREERWTDASLDAEKQRRRCLTIIDGLVSVTQQAWGVEPRSPVRGETTRIGG